jgi:hypothetical protein
VRCCVSVEQPEDGDYWKTHAIQEVNNLRVVPKLPLPKGSQRGMADISDLMGNNDENGSRFVRTLAELLVTGDTDDTYSPSEIMLSGYAGMAFGRLGSENFGALTCENMEQVGGFVAISNLAAEGDIAACQDVLCALLEGNPMYIDVICLFMSNTFFIGVEQDSNENNRICNTFDRAGVLGQTFKKDKYPPTLTPDQTHAGYIRVMNEGPLLLMLEMAKYPFGPAFFAAMQSSPYFHLTFQRLLRWVARETTGTPDGRAFGRKLRSKILPQFGMLLFQNDETTASFQKLLNRGPVSQDISQQILSTAHEVFVTPDTITSDTVLTMFGLA